MMSHSKIRHYGPLIGRVLLALLFIVSGFGILMNIGGTANFYTSIGIPMAMIAAIVVLVVKIGGGLMVATGLHAREGAWALIIFTLIATLVAHTGEGQLSAALKNLSVIGGLLMVAVYGAGPMSLEKKCPCPRCKKKVDYQVSAAGGACNCGTCPECQASKQPSDK